MTENQAPTPIDYANAVVEVASEKQASNIVMLNISQVSSFADLFVILSVESTPQMRALLQEIHRGLPRPSKVVGSAPDFAHQTFALPRTIKGQYCHTPLQELVTIKRVHCFLEAIHSING